jgi:Tol biopolymer transport system component
VKLSLPLVLAGVLVVLAGSASSTAAPGSAARVGSLILFWSDSPWPSLWSIRPDGSHRRRVFRTHQNCKRPVLSPNRKWIAFDGTPPGQRPLSQFDIQVMRRDGIGRRTLVPSPDRETDPQWSPDGTRISYVRLAEADVEDWRKSWIWTVRSDGTGARRLVLGSNARWSPDGKRLVFSAPTAQSDGDLFVINADGTGLRRLLATPRRVEWPTDWSPNGKKILFTRSIFGADSTDVYVMNADGTNVRRLTHVRGEDVGGTWSPDGTRIIFASRRFRLSHLFVMKANGRGERQLTRRNAEDFEPSWH